jgi:hypothetical protein
LHFGHTPKFLGPISSFSIMARSICSGDGDVHEGYPPLDYRLFTISAKAQIPARPRPSCPNTADMPHLPSAVIACPDCRAGL